MTQRRIKNILLKEWRVLFTDLNSTMIITLLPLLIIGQLTAYVWLAVRFGGEAILSQPVFQTALARLTQAMPAVATLPPDEQLKVLLISQFTFFLLLIPAMIAINAATFSIVEEKLSHSLEALLATPVRTWELLLGKTLAGAIPAVIVTWVCGGIFLGVVSGIGWGDLIGYIISPAWFLSLLLLNPAVAVLSFMLGVIGSSKAKDAKSAQTLALFVIFPVLALVAIQVSGLVWFTPLLTLALAVGIGIVDYLVLRIAVRLFHRESIVIAWR